MRINKKHYELIKNSLVKHIDVKADTIYSPYNIPFKGNEVRYSALMVSIRLEVVGNKLLIKPRADSVSVGFDYGQSIYLPVTDMKVLIPEQVRDFLISVYKYKKFIDKDFNVYFYVDLTEQQLKEQKVVLSLKDKIEIQQHYDWAE